MKQKIAILGAGISGISLAYYLDKEKYEVTVFEKSDAIGGCVKSKKVNEYAFELGPNTVQLKHQEVLELINKVAKDDLIYPSDLAKNRYILKKNKFVKAPMSPLSLFGNSLISLSSILKLLKEFSIKPSRLSEQASVKEVVVNHFGEEIYHNLFVPFCTGIYASNPENMTVKYGFPILWEAHQQTGSIIKHFKNNRRKPELNKIIAFKNGFQSFLEKLAKGINIQFKEEIESVSKQGEVFQLKFKSSQEPLIFDKVISCLPAHALANTNNDLAFLNKVSYSPVYVWQMAIPKSEMQKPQGFGVLTRAMDKHHFLGIIFNSDLFPEKSPKDKHLMTVMIGGERDKSLLELDEEEIKQTVFNELKNLFTIKGDVEFDHSHLWKNAIPQFHLNHESIIKEVKKFEEQNNDFYISGNYIDGVAIPDRILASLKLAKKING